jgi:hypothetical protein
MECWGVRELGSVGRGQLQILCVDFAVIGINRKPHLEIQSVDG